MRSLSLFLFLCFLAGSAFGQYSGRVLKITVLNSDGQPMPAASVQLIREDSIVLQTQGTDKQGLAEFTGLKEDRYTVSISYAGYETHRESIPELLQSASFSKTIQLKISATVLSGVTVQAKRPFVQFRPDKTVVNVEAGITNAGASLMDVLEKSPGISVGRDGTINMKGKPQVMVLIDGKQTQLNGADLQAYLSGINASQVDVIELIDNPGAKYDAAGNAGIINIRTKTTRQKGFNGSMSMSYGQGYYPKGNGSLNLNYRAGKFNFYLNYGARVARERMKIEALRTYFDRNGNDSLLLDQPNVQYTKVEAHNAKAGMDFFAGKQTTIGVAFTGNLTNRDVRSVSTIDWMTPDRHIDSTINTWGTRTTDFRRKGVNFNFRHTMKEGSEIFADLDIIRFTINGAQLFQTQLTTPGSQAQKTKGDLPSELEILTAKIDFSKKFKSLTWESGMKTAHTKTDNMANYYYYDGMMWQDDLGRSNHFLYDENIHAAYSSIDAKKGKWHLQTGLRYEFTSYKANQLGNSVVKDSAFNKRYGSLFPTAFVTYELDSSNMLTFRFGRRIDRPQFQNLNPFLVTLNKYTFEGGNPFIRPQYTWNFELLHSYKQALSIGVSYNYLKDYFSQIFVIDSNNTNVNKNIIIYTRGNVGTFHNFGATVTLQVPVTKWWNLTSTAVYNHKIIKGKIWAVLRAEVDQLNINLNNQFQLKKGWAAELTGYYQTNSQIDLQESLTPQGEMGFGISKQILKNRGTLRLNFRDIFYTQNYSGYSTFENSDEPFSVKWDSRVVRLTFNWRFGQALKAIRRSAGSATEETERVGTGN